MGTVNVRFFATSNKVGQTSGPAGYGATAAHPRMTIADATGFWLVIPFAPQEGEWGGFANRWAEIERPGRGTVLTDTGPGFRTVAFTLLVAYPNRASVASVLRGLADIAARGDNNGVVTVGGMAGMEAGPWRLTDMTVRVLQRQHGTNEPIMAEVDLAFGSIAWIGTHIGKAKKKKKRGGG